MSKKKLYMVSLSGGKDSTAMLLRLIEEKRPIDLILFCDTGLEFPQMYEHLKKLQQYIGREITYLKAEHSFEYYFSEYMPKRRNPNLEKYSGMSWGGPYNRWCTAMLKTRVIAKYLKELKKEYEVIEYIGTFADYWSNDDEEIDTKRTYLYNLKTGESRELHARSKEGMLLSKTTTNYVMDGKIYATRLELDYTGEEEFNSSPHEGEFVPETRQFIEVYDPETQEVERICEIPNYYLLVGLTNKRFFFKDKDGVTWSSNHKGENITEEKNMDFDFIMVCGKYLYPPEEFDYKKVGYNIRGYDLETDSSFPIDFGMVINAALVDSGRLCFTTNSNIDEYKEFNKNSGEYVRKLYPEASERQEILNLKSKIRDKLLYSGTFQMYVTDARGENRKLVYEGEHMNFSPLRMFGNYIFGSVSYGDPNNDFRKINTPDDGRCVINLETGEITPIPYLDTITDNQQ